jgi:predicted MFS family arabinose efflux permease
LIKKNYLLAILTVVLAFNCVDRSFLGLALEDIKADLGLSDTQLGLLTGIAFALFYSLMGIPIARWADRGNRVTIIAATTALWSIVVSLCGLAGSFAQLLAIRVAVAVGEAGCIPPAHSLIADYFPRAERPRAVARYMLGYPLSIVLGYFVAGWLNEVYGWRVTFMLLGVPGVALALWAWLALEEPRNDPARNASAGEEPASNMNLKEVFTTLWANVTFRHLLLAVSVTSLFSYGIAQWMPTFFVRSYGLKSGELGTWLAVMWGAGGMIGTYLGGEWASRHAAGNERLQLKVIACVNVGFGIVMALVYVVPSFYWAFFCLGAAIAGGITVNGPMFATVQTLVPSRLRAISVSLVYLFANLIGLGVGPLAAGALSDALRPAFADESLRYALLALCPGWFWAAWHVWRGSKTVNRDLQAIAP